MRQFRIIKNDMGTFNIQTKKYWFSFWRFVMDPKVSRFMWQATTKRGAQAYINLLKKK